MQTSPSSASVREESGVGARPTAPTTVERYAQLHRQLESGRCDDELLTKLIAACVELDKRDEALRVFELVRSSAIRRGLRRDLARHGWASAQPTTAETLDLRVAGEVEPPFAERYLDALQYLTDGRMPTLVVAGTLAFPLVLALGGALTAIDPSMPFRAIAAVPALLVVGLIGTIGRRVLLRAMQGLQDADDVPSFGTCLRETPVVLVQLLGAIALLLGPAFVLSLFGAWAPALLLAGVALLLLPMALTRLFASSDWRSLQPLRLAVALRAGGRRYLYTVLVMLPLALPGTLACLLTAGMPIFTMLAIVGPLVVAPGWMAARMFGLFVHRRKADFAAEALPTTTGKAIPAALWR